MRIILIIITIFISSCNRDSYHLDKDELIANKIMKTVALKVMEKTGLHPSGTGGQMMDEIKMLALAFDCYKEIEIEEARELLVAIGNEFLSAINTSEEIRPYLKNYPFEPKNIEIRIFIFKSDRSNVLNGNLAVASLINGLLNYKINDPEGPLFKSICKETYDEALQHIEQASQKSA